MTGSSLRDHRQDPGGSPPVGPDADTPPATYPARPEAAILAWIFPGLGHLYVGHRARGLLVMAAMLLLIGGGVLIGGPDVVDRKNDRLWFIAQCGSGPMMFGLDAFRTSVSPAQTYDFSTRSRTDDRQRYEDADPEMTRMLRRASVGHLNEIGTLFIALAGLMNIVVALDFLNPHRIPAAGERASTPDGGTGIRRSPGAMS